MSAKAKVAPHDALTIEEFLAFTDSRPQEERWELIEGEPVMSPSPVDFHQIVVANITAVLWNCKNEHTAPWFVLSGTGTRSTASAHSLLQPDVMVKAHAPTGSAVSDDCLVAFEVLSRSNAKADQVWRRKFYAAVPNCAHYVTVSIKSRLVTLHSRADAWEAKSYKSMHDAVPLPALGMSLKLADIYRFTPHDVL